MVADLSRESYSRVADLNRQFADLNLGFVDAAVIAIAEALGLGRIATTDRRDFGAVRTNLNLGIAALMETHLWGSTSGNVLVRADRHETAGISRRVNSLQRATDGGNGGLTP